MKYETIRDWLKENWGFWLSRIIWTTLIFLFILAMVSKEPHPGYDHQFKQGDVICMKITNEKAQVIESRKSYESIQIRIAVTSSIASDGSTTTARKYEKMWVADFEVEECK